MKDRPCLIHINGGGFHESSTRVDDSLFLARKIPAAVFPALCVTGCSL
jgi:hypothetical protein